jgi:ATP-binding cassette subfamily B protein
MSENKNNPNPQVARPGIGFGGRPGGPMQGMGPKVKPKNSKGTLKRLWNYISKQRVSLIIVLILTVTSSALALLGPRFIGKAIDDYIIPKNYNGLIRISIALLGVYAASAFVSAIQTYIMAAVSQRTVWEMRNDLFKRLQKLPLKFFDSKTHGEIMSRTTNDIENVTNTLNQSLAQLINSFITLIGTVAMMLFLSVRLTLLSLILIPAMTMITKKIAGKTRKYFTEQQKNLGELNGYIEETISGQKVVKVYCREEKSKENFNNINIKLKNVGIKAQILSGIVPPIMNMLNNMGYAIIAGVGGWMAVEKLITVGIIVSFLNYVKQFTRPLNELANQFNTIQSAIAGAERVFEIMDEEPEYNDNENKVELKDVKGTVALKNVDFSYKKDVPILKNISLTAKPGDTIALVGPTGAGKTTIVNLLTRFYDIDCGRIEIDGADIQNMDKNSLRKQIAIVLQDAYLFSETIKENIRYGKLDATDEEIEAAAKMANADGFIKRLPHGYNTVLTAEGSNLSQGQRQLITIARAILANPAILILDEATSSVDTRTEMHIQEAMKALMKGRTSFVIAHRLSTIREADAIMVIDGGEIIERGTHEELLAAQGFYYNLYISQFKRVV